MHSTGIVYQLMFITMTQSHQELAVNKVHYSLDRGQVINKHLKNCFLLI